ncbi:hypothetical protein HPB48_011697 [Haemaphysalis longicornis]|uniref:Uncharacterized protein n=1 Tax=Haemaphysalis longicornis TaxID=44386 RepID=A0A9J6GP88_HAELO|nr:hypothetical protein HPB48_011697 [Haemaphysalis longicornis]
MPRLAMATCLLWMPALAPRKGEANVSSAEMQHSVCSHILFRSVLTAGASGKKQRKNSEDHRRSSGTVGGEPQHGDESRYKRLAQELPGFNWLEQKIMGHGGGNFADAPPMPKHATMREPLAITAPTAHEKAEPKAAAPAPEVQRIYPPGTDILSRSMSEIQDDCCEEDAVDENPVIENVAV